MTENSDSTTQDNSGAIPADLANAITRQTQCTIARTVPRGGGGASRQGAVITLCDSSGGERQAYLAWDTRTGDPQRAAFFRREVAILQALSDPLASSGVLVPGYIASFPDHLALLTDMVAGSDRFDTATDPHQLGHDFIGQLAALHRIDPQTLALDGFGDAGLPPSTHIHRRIAQLREENLATVPDPLLILALDWLERNIPEDRGPAVIVHGDAGAGNFLHENNRVTAMLDWELCHYGDPMEDLAQIWVRSLFQSLLPMREVFAAYDAAGTVAVDLDRVRYHRLYFQLGFTVTGHANFYGDFGGKPAMLGLVMLFQTAHMRVIALSLAELTGQSLDEVPLPEQPAGPADASFATALDDLAEVITPRLADQQARTKAKSLARLVKWWRARDRYGTAFERAELDEINSALGTQCTQLLPARKALAEVILQGGIAFEDALQLCYNRVRRDTALMADAMGSLKDCYFPPLD
jgi:aminoglycoside phosphotransferase (APT) family kinase protein